MISISFTFIFVVVAKLHFLLKKCLINTGFFLLEQVQVFFHGVLESLTERI